VDIADVVTSASVMGVIISAIFVVITVAAWVTFFQMGADLRRLRVELGAIREFLQADYDERHRGQ